jgi:hypothetical protein
MSTLTTTNEALIPATATAKAKPARKPFWRAVSDSIAASRERRAEREIAAYIERHGGQLTDEVEREIMRHLNGQSQVIGR